MPLGIAILDLTRLLPGAAATALLAERGAEVIKIEQPGGGDYARSLIPAVFAATNAGKKSVSINLKDPRGRDLLISLVRNADVLIEGFRPGTMKRLGLGYNELREVNQRIIYASLTGYGQSGAYADLAGHDVNYLALSGVLDLNLPVIPGVQIADLAGGAMQAVIAILFALLERGATGEGRYLDVSMLAGVESLLTIPLAAYRTTGRAPRAGEEILSGRYACYNLYEASDSRWLAVGALEPKFWAALCGQLECEDLIPLQFCEDERREAIKNRVASIFRMRTASEWFDALRSHDCCVTPVLNVAEVAARMPQPDPTRRPPRLGEHTRPVLDSMGVGAAELDALEAAGVIESR
jgi:crotonobetainyl-CoA:carnitine CoA-transferase CaiB-like acyl-CoA transferase